MSPSGDNLKRGTERKYKTKIEKRLTSTTNRSTWKPKPVNPSRIEQRAITCSTRLASQSNLIQIGYYLQYINVRTTVHIQTNGKYCTQTVYPDFPLIFQEIKYRSVKGSGAEWFLRITSNGKELLKMGTSWWDASHPDTTYVVVSLGTRLVVESTYCTRHKVHVKQYTRLIDSFIFRIT